MTDPDETNVEPQTAAVATEAPAGVPAEQPEEQVTESVDWETKYKELQSATQKKIERLKNRPQPQAVNSVDAERLRRLELQQAQILDDLSRRKSEYEFEDDENKPSAKTLYADTLERQRQEEAEHQYNDYVAEKTQEMEDTLEENELDWNHPELKKIQEETNFAVAQSKFYKTVNKIIREKANSKINAAKEEIEANLKRELIKNGALRVSTGPSAGSTGAVFTRQQIKDMAGTPEYEKRRSEIEEALNAGRIKD